ncbi:hypothetical protein BDN72DRAFT_855188 [Pluteus cervinus]|uniref:Uncharacterized protein n=1 Tax=Pluteus cervinus TaxID=181527 RepID=A0ACD3B4Q4_9AGAR|nr:hypothetical protein BDN72DRAFT_855188 [Pluteus cervinus]
MADAVLMTNYLKVAGASIYVFDLTGGDSFLQKSILRLSIACWLLIAVRYLGMLGIILSMVGAFSTTFTHSSCDHYFLSVPLVKVFGAVASQAIFVYRTYAICNRSRRVLISLSTVNTILSTVMIISPIVVPRAAKLGPTGNCVSDLSKGSTSWIQYACQVIFDAIILVITFNRLFRGVDKRTRSEFSRVLWESQVIYFLAVTAINIGRYPIQINLVVFIKFNKSTESTMFATLGIAITAIFGGRVILALHEAGYNNNRGYHSSGVSAYNTTPVTDRHFRVVTIEDDIASKVDNHRMSELALKNGGGIHVQREVVVDATGDLSPTSDQWDRKMTSMDSRV